MVVANIVCIVCGSSLIPVFERSNPPASFLGYALVTACEGQENKSSCKSVTIIRPNWVAEKQNPGELVG